MDPMTMAAIGAGTQLFGAYNQAKDQRAGLLKAQNMLTPQVQGFGDRANQFYGMMQDFMPGGDMGKAVRGDQISALAGLTRGLSPAQRRASRNQIYDQVNKGMPGVYNQLAGTAQNFGNMGMSMQQQQFAGQQQLAELAGARAGINTSTTAIKGLGDTITMFSGMQGGGKIKYEGGTGASLWNRLFSKDEPSDLELKQRAMMESFPGLHEEMYQSFPEEVKRMFEKHESEKDSGKSFLQKLFSKKQGGEDSKGYYYVGGEKTSNPLIAMSGEHEAIPGRTLEDATDVHEAGMKRGLLLALLGGLGGPAGALGGGLFGYGTGREKEAKKIATEKTAFNKKKQAGGGMLRGVHHAAGGMDAGNGVEVQHGEYVVNATSANKHKDLLHAINEDDNEVSLMDTVFGSKHSTYEDEGEYATKFINKLQPGGMVGSILGANRQSMLPYSDMKKPGEKLKTKDKDTTETSTKSDIVDNVIQTDEKVVSPIREDDATTDTNEEVYNYIGLPFEVEPEKDTMSAGLNIGSMVTQQYGGPIKNARYQKGGSVNVSAKDMDTYVANFRPIAQAKGMVKRMPSGSMMSKLKG